MDSFRDRLVEEIPQLRAFARFYIKNTALADDFLQDALIHALEKEHLYEEGDFGAWLRVLLRNRYLDFVRSAHEVFEKLSENGILPEPQQDEFYPYTRAEMALDLQKLSHCIAELPQERREVITLICLEEQSQKKVSKILEIKQGTVQSRTNRGKAQLREMFQVA